jgi:hypothetical protein
MRQQETSGIIWLDYVSLLCLGVSFHTDIDNQRVADGQRANVSHLPPGEEFDCSRSCRVSGPSHFSLRSLMVSTLV